MIGRNAVLGLFYVLQVIIFPNQDKDIWDGNSHYELIFTVKAYRFPNDDSDPEVYYSGTETKRHFPDPGFRQRIVSLLVAITQELVRRKNPKRIYFVAKSSAMPPKAELKYHKIAERLREMGYQDKATTPEHTNEAFAWYFTRH